MSFLDKLFANKNSAKQPDIQFGRYSDSFKNTEKYRSWDKSIALFEDNRYLDACKAFFFYLQDEETDNVNYNLEGKELKFFLYQGSKKIEGVATQQYVRAEAKIAKNNGSHIGILRKLLEENFQLRYGRYALDEDGNITMIFTTSSLDCSPYKLYHALKELATHADKKDDILIEEFKDLVAINTNHTRSIGFEEKQVKYQFFQRKLSEVVETVETSKLSIDQHPGAFSYLMLDAVYKLDYLLKPEGQTLDTFEGIHKLYFNNNTTTIGQKNKQMFAHVKRLLKTSENSFAKEIYEVKSTFGINSPSTVGRLAQFYINEIKNMDWYYKNGFEAYAFAIPSYIVGYTLFSNALPKPMRLLLQLYYHIFENEFFKKLGATETFRKNGRLEKRAIRNRIAAICEASVEHYPNLEFRLKALRFKSDFEFVQTYLKCVFSLDLSRNDIDYE